MEKVGVLALQGSFAEHLAILRRIPGIKPLEVKTIAQLEAVDRLIIPGGESTAIGKLLRKTGMLPILQKRIEEGLAPVKNGDILTAQNNLQPLSMLGTANPTQTPQTPISTRPIQQ